MKIFGIGLNRTGTKSLSMALNLLGYTVNHFPRDANTMSEMYCYLKNKHFSLSVANTFDSVIDVVPAVMFEGLYEKYPDAMYILTVRDTKSWYKSMKGFYEKHLNACFSNFSGEPYTRFGQYIAKAHKHLYGTEVLYKDVYTKKFKEYNENKIKFFEGRPNFLAMDICAGDGWEMLCPFLDKEYMGNEFPRIVNTDDNKNNYFNYRDIML